MMFRLRLALSGPASARAYRSPEEFAKDLHLMHDSLAANKGGRIGALLVEPLLRKLDTFGFHLYTLDLRQHARVHAKQSPL
jgi:phosphoenolpyruvate carboxylase